MSGVRIPHDLNGEDRFILGLSVSRVAVLLFGTLAGLHVRLHEEPSPVPDSEGFRLPLTG